MIKHFDARDFIAGAALVAVGLFVALYASSHYKVGEPAHMGPGFFPTVLGWVLAGLGAITVLFSFRRTVHAFEPPPFALRPFLAVLLAVAAFSLLIDRLGLVPTALIMTVIAAFASDGFHLGRALVLGVCLAALSWLIFSVGLQMTLPAFAFPG